MAKIIVGRLPSATTQYERSQFDVLIRELEQIVNQYGSQSVVASIDYKKQGLKNAEVHTDNGEKKIKIRSGG